MPTQATIRRASGAIILCCAGATLAQDVTFTRFIGRGDPLPGGHAFAGGGLPAVEGDYIAMNASTSGAYEAIVVYHIPTGELTTLADTATFSPTWGEAFKTLGNPSIHDGQVVYPGAAPLYTSEWDGLYRTPIDRPGEVSIVADETHPFVRTPTLQAINKHGVAYREKGAARGPIFFTDLGGDVVPVARPGDPTPEGGAYIEMDPPTAGGDLVAFYGITDVPSSTPTGPLWSAYAWDARTQIAQLIIQEGQPVPDRPGEVFEHVYVADTDGRRTLVGGDYGQLWDTYDALYTWDGETLERLVQSGDPIPGTGGATFSLITGLALDGDLALFRHGGPTGEHDGVYAVRDGRIFRILHPNMTIDGREIYGYNLSNVGLSDGRLLLYIRYDRLGGDSAFYLAEIGGGACRADLDGDGELTIFDFLAFQTLFDAGDPQADFDGDGELTIFDFLAFQTAFDAGCE